MPPQLQSALPVLRISSGQTAETFYCDKLGFTKLWENIPGPDPDPVYMGIRRDNVELHLSSHSGDGQTGNVVNFYTPTLDALYTELAAKAIAFDLEPYDQSWGTREMYLQDPDGNKLRFIQAQ